MTIVKEKDSLEARIKEMYLQGHLISQIMKALNVSRFIIKQYVKTWNIPKPKRLKFKIGRPSTIINEQRLRKLVDEGYTNIEICKILHVSERTISKHYKKHGIVKRKKYSKLNIKYTCPICDHFVEINSKSCVFCSVGFHEPKISYY